MGKLIAIVGQAGSGKSSAIESLDPKETYIINVQNKPLPFKGSGKLYNEKNKNIAGVDDWGTIINILSGINEKRSTIKNIIIDDAGFIMSTEFFSRAKETGYEKFNQIGQHMFNIINTAKKLNDDINVVFIFHEDLNMVDGQLPQRKIKTIGRVLDDKYEPAASFTVLLHADVSFNKEGKGEYGFITNRTPDYPAKSPKGMFDKIKVPNDLGQVLKKINEYYEG